MNLIYENNNSVCPELCEEIINLFEKNKNKRDGLTLGGVNKKVKDTTDLTLNKTDSEWSEIFIFLESELTNNCNSKAGSNKSYKKKCYQSLLRKKPECEGQTTFFGKFDFEKTKKCLNTN